jgi:hypothetical protein
MKTQHKPDFDLDRLLTPAEGAVWLGMKRRTLIRNIKLRRIPAIKINERVVRIHPRSVLAAISSK